MTGSTWSSSDLLLPERTRLLHIGPHKTGTTALQDAFVLARHELGKHGVFFPPNKQRQPMRAALSITDRPALRGEAPARTDHWDSFLRRVNSAGDDRVMISSEFFADATDEQARTVAEGLGVQDLHLVVTLRPLSRILPSQWQQYVQNGTVTPYERWLQRMLLEPPYDKPNPSLWRRHDHPRLIERWAEAVGYDRVTVVVVDESDRAMLLRVFESFLGLPEGLLRLDNSATNRSLTWGEVELLRLLNKEFKKREWPDSYYARFLRYGGINRVRTEHQPLPLEPRITTPAWAEERAAEIGQRFAERIEAMGVRVIGDLSSLAGTPTGAASTGTSSGGASSGGASSGGASTNGDGPSGDAPSDGAPSDGSSDGGARHAVPEPILSASAAAEVVVGTILASSDGTTTSDGGTGASSPTGKGGVGTRPSTTTAKRPTRVEERLVANVRTKQLLRVVASRVRKRVARLFRPATRQRPGAAPAAATASTARATTSADQRGTSTSAAPHPGNQAESAGSGGAATRTGASG